MINWEEVLKVGSEDVAEHISKRSADIISRYGEADNKNKKKGVDIVLKLVLTEDDDDTDSVTVKSRISLAGLRIVNEKERTVSPQGALPLEEEPDGAPQE